MKVSRNSINATKVITACFSEWGCCSARCSMHGQSLYTPRIASTQGKASTICSAVSLALLSRLFFLHRFSQTPGHTQNFYHSNPFYLPCSGNQQRYQQDLKPTALCGVAHHPHSQQTRSLTPRQSTHWSHNLSLVAVAERTEPSFPWEMQWWHGDELTHEEEDTLVHTCCFTVF